jgi:hypothetical protein
MAKRTKVTKSYYGKPTFLSNRSYNVSVRFKIKDYIDFEDFIENLNSIDYDYDVISAPKKWFKDLFKTYEVKPNSPHE